MKAANIDFTTGDITSNIIRYTIPVFIANCINELYNITNSIIVGNFVSTKALSAVSACQWICNIFNFTFYGLGMGAGILVANLYGAKDSKKLKQAMDTSVVFAILGGIGLTILAELSLPLMMKLCNIAPDIYNDSLSYLRVYLLGNTAVLTYQMCFFIIRSLGDSKHPLYYMIVSCITNILLGVLFVRVLDLSIIGTALATIISQYIVNVLSLRLLFNFENFKFDIHNINFSFDTVKRICELGIPSGIQNMLIALSSLLIQAYVNTFSNEIIAGIGVAEKTAAWGQMPSLALVSALMALISQNYGAKNYDRLKLGIKKISRYGLVSTTIVVIIMEIFAEPLIAMYNSNPEVIYHGAKMLRITSISYLLINYSHVYNGACRAVGNVKAPMMIAIMSQVVCKYLFVMIFFNINHSINSLYGGSAFGYGMAGILATIYFYTSKRTKIDHLR